MVAWKTERLILRPWTHSESDVDRIFDAYSRWEVVRYLGAAPRMLQTRDQAYGAVDRWAQRSTPDGRYGLWACEVKQTAVVAGTVLLVPLPPDAEGREGEIEVGWHFHPDSWGHGFATEAARSVLDKGFADGLDQIYALVRPENAASSAVCRRLGMNPLGCTNRWYDTELELFGTRRPGCG